MKKRERREESKTGAWQRKHLLLLTRVYLFVSFLFFFSALSLVLFLLSLSLSLEH